MQVLTIMHSEVGPLAAASSLLTSMEDGSDRSLTLMLLRASPPLMCEHGVVGLDVH